MGPSLLCPSLVGREVETAVLDEHLDAVRHGRGGVVVLVGDAGAGKSRLVREAADAARDAGLRVLAGRAVPGGSPVPYRPLTEAFLAAFRAVARPAAPELDGFAGHLSRLVPTWPAGPAGVDDSSGSGETASRRRIFTCRPERPGDGNQAENCAATILATMARRAYRGPVTKREVDVLVDFFRAGQARDGFEGGIRSAMERLLVDPRFLLRVERDPAGLASGAASRVSALELASRLSFFLWSSIPDDELLDAAMNGSLSEPSIIERQVRRMLADNRSAALVHTFANQWLSLPRLRDVAPDPELFPEFDGTLRAAFLKETELFLESQLARRSKRAGAVGRRLHVCQ